MANNVTKAYEIVEEIHLTSHNDRFNGDCVKRVNNLLKSLREDPNHKKGYRTISVCVTDVDDSGYRTITICYRYMKKVKKESNK